MASDEEISELVNEGHRLNRRGLVLLSAMLIKDAINGLENYKNHRNDKELRRNAETDYAWLMNDFIRSNTGYELPASLIAESVGIDIESLRKRISEYETIISQKN